MFILPISNNLSKIVRVNKVYTNNSEKKKKENDENDELMMLREKEAKECVAYHRRDLTSITFCLVSLDRKRAVCTRHQGILMTCHNNPTIERNSAINNPSQLSTSNRRFDLFYISRLFVIISGIFDRSKNPYPSKQIEIGKIKIGTKRRIESFSLFVLSSWLTMCCHVPLLRFFVSG